MPLQFPNIPGTILDYHDDQIVFPITGQATGNVTIVDYALWGPVNEPVSITKPEEGQMLFGKDIGAYGLSTRARGYNGSVLARSMSEVFQAGNRNQTLVRLDFGGAVASTELAFQTDTLTATTNTAGSDPDPGTGSLGTSAVITCARPAFTVLPGMKCWSITAPTTYGAIGTVLHAVNSGTEQAPTLTVTLEPKAMTTTGTSWAIGFGLLFQAAYPGEVGNSLQFRIIEDPNESDTRSIQVKVPAELGGYSYTFSSRSIGSFGDMITRANRYLQDIAIIAVSGIDLNTSMDFLATLPDPAVLALQEVADTDDAFYTFGETITPSASFRVDYTAGTDYDDTLYPGFTGDTLAYQTDLTQKAQWYATALGNCLDENDDAKCLSLLRGQDLGVLVVPSLYMDDLVDSDGNVANMTYADGVITGATHTSAESTLNPLQYLLDFCHQQNIDGLTTELVMGCSPLTSTTIPAINARYNSLLLNSFMFGTLANTDGDLVTDLGRYLSVVAGPMVQVNSATSGGYFSSGALQYASLLTTTPPSTPPTQKQIRGISGVGYNFLRRQISMLAGGQGDLQEGGAFVVFDSTTGTAIVNLGVTAAKRSSFYAKIHNRRIAQSAARAVRGAVQPFIGNAFGMTQFNAMSTCIQSALDDQDDRGVLNGKRGVGYDFLITQTDVDAVLGVAHVALSIRPPFELDWVTIDVRVSL